MKTVKTLALLLLAAATGNSAMAQQAQVMLPNKSYTFAGSAATGSGDITYQWYRNGEPIEGATAADYILPAGLAQGVGVEFKRGAMSSTCPGEVTFSNISYISFCGLVIDGVTCWANENAAAGNVFASRIDEYTPYFQWNRTTAWAGTGDISGWNSTGDNAATTWSNNPCPTGWRLPTTAEFQSLLNNAVTWAAANAKGNAVEGAFFGPNHASCMLPNNMEGCIFLPAMSYRENTGTIFNNSSYRYGYYWSSSQSQAGSGQVLQYSNYSYSPTSITDLLKSYGAPIRCVYAN